MKIVLLDGGAVNPGDLSWDWLHEISEDVTIYDYTNDEDVIKRMADCELLITNKVNIDRKIIDAIPSLKCIFVTATGFNNIDINYAREKGIPVCNVPAYSSNSVAQIVFALLLEIINNVAKNNESVQKGDWKKAKLYTYQVTAQNELFGKTIGIVGFGNIGQTVARIAHAFGMKVLVNTRTEKAGFDYVTFVDFESLLKKSDVVSLHTALNKETENIMDEKAFDMMKESAIFINAARGGLIDEQALINALRNKKIRAAALDVIKQEPMEEDCKLLGIPNLIITPHIAWATIEARARMMEIIKANILSFLNEQPINVVNM